MGKPKLSDKNYGGPWLAMAVFCESIMQDASGKHSAIGIIDGISFLAGEGGVGVDVPSDKNPLNIFPNMLIIFRTGSAPGQHKFKLVIETPDGKRKTLTEQDLTFTDAPNGGFTIKTQAHLQLTSDGLFWIDIYLDNKRYTRMPLNITLQRLVPAESKQKKK
jgi:hypothetical protein